MTTFLKKKWQTLTLFVLIFALLAFLFSIIQPQKYRAEQRFLLVSEYAEDVDPYAATRSTEYLTSLLSEVMYSQDFLNRVLDSGYALDESLFPEIPKKRKKAWQKTLGARVLADTGILDVTVYHKNRFIAEQLALAVGEVLQTQHARYHSRGNAVAIHVIDAPATSLRPVQPNVPLNTGVGAVLGLIAGLAFIYLFPQREWKFLSDRERLVGASEPDWSKPLATPQTIPARSGFDYEFSELKYPTRKAQGDTWSPEDAHPPSNLPIA